MSNPQSTTGIAVHSGSTKPIATGDRSAREAAKIREVWHTRSSLKETAGSFDSTCLQRHKSLILNLALDEYNKKTDHSAGTVELDDYCRQYSWLGDPLQHSIFRLLEVQEFLNEHPEALLPEQCFDWPQPGDDFLRFHVLEELGRGASGRVYLCAQRNLGDKRAVLKIESGSNVDEPALLGKLDHPNITPIHWADFDPTLGVSFLCMPFLGRSTLVDLIQYAFQNGTATAGSVVDEAARLWMDEADLNLLEATALPRSTRTRSTYITRIAGMAKDLASALAFVHERNIIHGDIKPSNVLLSPLGQPYLLDFNLSRIRKTPYGRYGGTPAYMAPEQIQQIRNGKLSFPDNDQGFSTDIYSFGVLLYELLAGQPPYTPPAKHDNIETLVRQMTDLQEQGCLDIRARNPGVDQRLAELIHACLALDPAQRPQKMREVEQELQRVNVPLARGRRYVRQKPKTSVLIALAMLGPLGLLTKAYLSMPPRDERLFLRAAVARQEGDFPTGVRLLNEVLVINPAHTAARLLRARAYHELHEYDKADQELRILNRTAPDPATTAYLAYNLHFVGNPTGAADLYEQAMKLGYKNSAVLNNLILDHFLSSRPLKTAEKIALTAPLLEEALRLNPDSPQIRMTAFTFYRKHHKRFEPEILTAAQAHIDWLAANLPEHESVWQAIHENYTVLETLGLIDKRQVESAKEKLQTATIKTPLRRFLDPLESDHETVSHTSGSGVLPRVSSYVSR
ncbi:MAG: protein kinase domain-containing protein [Bythopirellula sp.]